MLKDFLYNCRELLKELGSRLRASRLFILGSVYAVLIAVMVMRLYDLQIIHGESYLNDYIQMTEKTVTTPATRGNIFDCNGKLLAYNRLSYDVTVTDTGAYRTVRERNEMLLRLVRLLNRRNITVTGRLEIGLDDNGTFVFTSSGEEARKRFLRDLYGLRRVEELTGSTGRYPSVISAEDLINALFLLRTTQVQSVPVIFIRLIQMIADDQRYIQMPSFFVRCKNIAQPCVFVGVPVRNINSTVICSKQTLPKKTVPFVEVTSHRQVQFLFEFICDIADTENGLLTVFPFADFISQKFHRMPVNFSGNAGDMQGPVSGFHIDSQMIIPYRHKGRDLESLSKLPGISAITFSFVRHPQIIQPFLGKAFLRCYDQCIAIKEIPKLFSKIRWPQRIIKILDKVADRRIFCPFYGIRHHDI